MEDEFDDGFNQTNLEDNYYTFLNISKDATIEDINTAYRSLSRIYHPDKHVNLQSKQKAELLFNRTKKAYEVLSDPHKRAIYDSLGVKGLQTEGWEIVHRTKTPQEIREEYERLAKDREERRLLQRTNPKGSITINVNAMDMFNAYDDNLDEPVLFPTIEVSGMSISQSIDAPMTTRDTCTMSGNLSSQNGIGSGNFLVSGRRLINKGWLALDVGAGNGPNVGIKGSRTLSQRVFCNGGTNIHFRKNGIFPGIVGTLAVQLGKHTVGYLTYNAGIQSTMSTVFEHNTEKQHYLLNCTIGIPHCFISGSYIHKFSEHEMKIKLAAKVGTFGYIAEYGAEKKISKYSSVFASISIGVPTGVILKIKVIRSSQSFIIPIHLSEEIIPAAIFYGTVTPLLAWFFIKNTIIEPINAEQKRKKIDQIKETNKQRMAEKRKEAEAAIDLMQAQYDRICNEEKNKKGLIIISAIYGRFGTNSTNSSHSILESYNEAYINVTIPLQCLIRDSKLKLPESSKSQLPGFYDPCVGEEKSLKIDYIYRNINYNVIIQDNEILKIPKV